MSHSLSQWEFGHFFAVSLKKVWENFVPVTFRWTERSQSSFYPVPLVLFWKNDPSDSQVGQNILIIFHAYCSSHFSSKISSQSNFVQHFVPAEYFTQIIVTFDFSTQNSVPVHLRANFFCPSQLFLLQILSQAKYSLKLVSQWDFFPSLFLWDRVYFELKLNRL